MVYFIIVWQVKMSRVRVLPLILKYQEAIENLKESKIFQQTWAVWNHKENSSQVFE